MLVRTKEGDDSAVASGPGDLESSGATASPREQDSGVALHIPNWTGHEVCVCVHACVRACVCM